MTFKIIKVNKQLPIGLISPSFSVCPSSSFLHISPKIYTKKEEDPDHIYGMPIPRSHLEAHMFLLGEVVSEVSD
jgi:hypothetical protein